MTSRTAVLHAFCLALFFSLPLFLIRDSTPLVIVFYACFFIALPALAGLYILKKNRILANFYCGVTFASVMLIPFKALPFIPDWTREEAFLHFFGLPFHHWTIGSVIITISIFLFICHVKRDRLPSRLRECFQCFIHPYLISFAFGIGTFLFVSQIAEMVLHWNLFW